MLFIVLMMDSGVSYSFSVLPVVFPNIILLRTEAFAENW